MRTTLLNCLCAPALLCGLAAQDAGSTFGHARTRALAELGALPSPTDVAVADLVNFHRHRLPLPRAGEAVALDLRFGSAGFDRRGEAVLQVGYTGAAAADRAELGPVNLGLAIDCSGSMAAAGKMDAVKRALRVLVQRLRRDDRVTLVAWSETASVLISARRGDGFELERAIDRLEPGGNTNLHAGLMTALREVSRHAVGGGRSRVILLTDGIANRGVTEAGEILESARSYTRKGVDLATIGFGTNLNAELLDRLARGARGMFHFVRDGADVEKVFVDELQAQLEAVARRPELTLRLPDGLELLRVFGYEARRGERRGEYRIDLPDVNAGATQVVIAVCRLRHAVAFESADAGGPLSVTARFDYRGTDREHRHTIERRASIAPRSREGERLTDAEVRKNYTIARVAQALHDMAVAARSSRWVDADRALQDALRVAERHFPSGDDEDLRRVTDMARRYRKTLRPYLDRFRDA